MLEAFVPSTNGLEKSGYLKTGLLHKILVNLQKALSCETDLTNSLSFFTSSVSGLDSSAKFLIKRQ